MDLDERLREMFRDERLDLPVPAGVPEQIVARARRGRRIRVAAGACAVVVVALGVAGAVGLGAGTSSDMGSQLWSEMPTTTPPPEGGERPAYAKFRLGMPGDEARATGELELPGIGGPCVAYKIKGQPGDGVLISPDGVVGITLPPNGRTPSGLGAAMTLDMAKAVYPALVVVSDVRAVVPMAASWRYTLGLTGQMVTAVRIEQVGHTCGEW